MKVKLLLLSLFSLFLSFVTHAQLIQGTIKKGANDDQFEIWLRPDFSNSTQYLFQIGLPIAFPASAVPQPTGINVVLDPSFTAAFGSNYTVTVNPVATATGGAEKYFNIVLVRGGAGASNPQTWTAGTEFKVLTGTFTYAAGSTTFQAKLADYQDGGSDGQGNFYTQSGDIFYVSSTSTENFYASPGNSVVGGTAAAGYAQLMAAVNSGTVSGTSPLCIGATATYTSDGTAGGTWSSTNPAVASVDASTGLVTALSAGTTDITYTISGASSFKTLTVNPNVSAGTVTGTSPLCIGGTATFSSNGTAGGTWSSSNTSVATVDASTGLVTAVGAGTADITYTVNSGCGSPVSAFASLTVNPNVSAGTVSGTSPLTVGGTATYTSNGTAGGTWSSSNTSVATVDASTGLVTAVAAGTANIIYTVNSGCGSPVSAQQTLTVNAPTNAGVVSGTSPLCIGATATYTSDGDAGGTWSSTNTSVATVDASTGLVTAVAAGTTDITYTVNSVSAFKTLTVSPNVSAGTVSGTSPLTVGGTATYTSTGDAGGTWSSSNTSVATVDANSGLVTAVGAGTADIIYTINSGCGSPVSAQQSLTVNAPTNAGVVSGTSPLCIGGTATYTSDGDAGGTWSSTNTGVATVDASTGLVTAVAAGTADITYTVNSVSAFKTLTVSPNVNAGTVSGTSPLTVGQTATFTSNGTAGGTWSSSNTAVATVNASSGLVTAVGAGTTNITYTVNSGCGSPVSASASLTVNVAEVQLIQGTIKPGANPGEVEVWLKPSFNNSTQYLFQIGLPIAFPADAATQPTSLNVTLDPAFVAAFGSNYTVTVNPVATNTGGTEKYFNIVLVRGGAGASDPQTWTSGEEFRVLTATFNPAGSPGTQVKLADYQDGGSDGQGNFYTQSGDIFYVSSTSTENFYASPGNSVVGGTATAGYAQTIATIGCVAGNAGTVSGTSPLTVGQTATYTSNGDAGGTWSSSNTAVATVDANSGLVTAVAAGTADITYTVSSGCSPVSASASLTVNAPSNAGVVSGTSPLCIGGTATYTSDGDAGGTWSSSNTSVATVDASTGLVTAVGAGTADITYTVNSVSAFKTLTVSPNVSAGTVSGTSPLTVGQTATFSSTGDAGGTWSSSNTAVATVDANSGLVTAVAAGSANIIYTINSGCGSPVSASASLTVNVAEVQLIQGTIKPGANPGEIEVWLKPSFNNSTQYLFQIGLPIAFPADAATQPTSLNVTLDPAFVAAFGDNYTVTVNPVATNTGGTEKYFNIVLVRGGAGASDPQTWTSGEEFRVLTATFNPAGSPGTQVKLADYQDGGSDGQGNFYTQSGDTYFVSATSVENFYAAPGLSIVGGDAAAGYAQTIATIGACESPVVEAITGTTTVTVGATTQLANTTAGGVWSSDNEAVATVDANGLVTGVAAGTATISYAVTNDCGTTTVTATVTVENCVLPEVGAISGTTTVNVGGTTQLSSTTGGGVWSSDNEAVATVDANGLVTGVAVGTATISYAVTNDCGTTTVTAIVTVEAPAQDQLIQGTIKPGAAPGTVEVWLKPNFNNSTQYLFQIGLPIAFPASGTVVEPTGLNVTLDPAFVAAFGSNYTVTVNPVATNTAGTEQYFNIVLVRGGDGASDPQTWTAGEEFRVLTATFVPGGSPGTQVKLADYQDGGSDGQGNFYTQSGDTYFVTANSIGNFYEAPGLSVVGGDAEAGYAQTIAAIGVCDLPVVEGITGNFEVCVGATTQLANTTAGGVWSSDNEAVATVDANGLVTGVAAGTATISYAVTNSCGTTTVTASISVAALPVLTTQNLSGGGCEGGSIDLNNGITSSVDGLTVAFFDDAGFSNPISNMVNSAGTYYVRVTNSAGCSATGIIEVTVSDTQNPVVTCPGNVNTTTSSCSKSIAIAKPTYSDNCSVVSLTWEMSGATTGNSPATGINFVGTKVFNAGETVITYTATDGAGNSATCSFVVKVKDSKAPVIKCPASITKNASGESCGADVAVGNPTVSDNCGVAVVSWVMTGATTDNSPTTGINYVGTHHFNVGTTTVKYTVKDASGNSATCSFTVKVVDKQRPTIDCPNDITEVVLSGCSKSITIPDPVYSDNCGSVTHLSWVMLGATNAISPLSGINTIGTRTFNVGVTYVTYAIRDASGNINACTFKVTVLDNTDPVVSCPGNITQSVSGKCNKSVTLAKPTFSDNCKVSKLTWVMSGATTGSSSSSGINYVGTKTFNVGTTTVTYTAKDASSNSASCSFTVTITNPKCSNNPGGGKPNGKDDLRLIVNPNPSSHFFTLRILTKSNEEVEVNVYDGHGRRVGQMRGSAQQTYKFGYMLKSGVYMVEVLQGDDRKVTRIVKL